MNKRVYKYYLDYEKEERWLNQMAAQGWMMKSFFLGFYHFYEDEPGAYIYRIELLPHRADSPKSYPYLRFMEDSGVEVAATWMRWVYFRRRACEGAFDIYTDRASRITHYHRVLRFFLPFCCLYWVVGLLNFWGVIDSLHTHANPLATSYLLATAVYFLGGIGFSLTAYTAYKQYKRLKKEQALRE